MTVRIGTNPIGWSNDDLPELGGETLLETCLAEARSAGFTGIELGNKFPRSPAALRPILERHGLDLVSGWYGSALRRRSVEEEKRAVEPHLALLEAMGCAVMVFAETSDTVQGNRDVPVSRRPVMADDEWRRFGEDLTAVAEHLQSRGIRMAYHHHMGTVVETGAEVDRLMAVTGDAVGLLFDTGHLTYAGAAPADVAERHAARIVHVHCKDVRSDVLRAAKARDGSFLDSVVDGVFTVPGDGSVDFPACLAPLARAGYRGWLVVEAEQDPAKAHPLTYAKLGYDNLTRMARTAGLMPEPARGDAAGQPSA
ncbi:MAG TPA: myo-inosose-2 dehydratase [Alphaproteobacteria bacterium]|nr:myo-inosose-2 dehydratase [Alphaproteobacteria bacterium]